MLRTMRTMTPPPTGSQGRMEDDGAPPPASDGGAAIGANVFFFSSRRRHTRSLRDWSSDVCSSDLYSGCGICAHCRIGWSQLCRAGITVYGVTAHGGHADRSEERRVGKECSSWVAAVECSEL